MSDSFNSTDLLLLREIKDDNENALNELIVKYRNTVDFIASKYINAPLEKDDLIQEGMIGLLAAIKSFNTHNRGLSLALTLSGHSAHTLSKVSHDRFLCCIQLPPPQEDPP